MSPQWWVNYVPVPQSLQMFSAPRISVVRRFAFVFSFFAVVWASTFYLVRNAFCVAVALPECCTDKAIFSTTVWISERVRCLQLAFQCSSRPLYYPQSYSAPSDSLFVRSLQLPIRCRWYEQYRVESSLFVPSPLLQLLLFVSFGSSPILWAVHRSYSLGFFVSNHFIRVDCRVHHSIAKCFVVPWVSS